MHTRVSYVPHQLYIHCRQHCKDTHKTWEILILKDSSTSSRIKECFHPMFLFREGRYTFSPAKRVAEDTTVSPVSPTDDRPLFPSILILCAADPISRGYRDETDSRLSEGTYGLRIYSMRSGFHSCSSVRWKEEGRKI